MEANESEQNWAPKSIASSSCACNIHTKMKLPKDMGKNKYRILHLSFSIPMQRLTFLRSQTVLFWHNVVKMKSRELWCSPHPTVLQDILLVEDAYNQILLQQSGDDIQSKVSPYPSSGYWFEDSPNHNICLVTEKQFFTTCTRSLNWTTKWWNRINKSSMMTTKTKLRMTLLMGKIWLVKLCCHWRNNLTRM